MSKKIDSDFGARLKQAAENVGLPYSQTKIGEHLGVSRQHVDAWLKGTLPRADQLYEMADKFKVDARWLATGQKDAEETTHENKRIIPSGKNAEKILEVLAALLDTDSEGVEEIAAAVESLVGENAATERPKRSHRVKRSAR